MDGIENKFNCEQLNKLVSLLDAKGVRWNNHSDMYIERIRFHKNGKVYSAICGPGTYGNEQGLLEMMVISPIYDPEGFLTAEDVMRRVGF